MLLKLAYHLLNWTCTSYAFSSHIKVIWGNEFQLWNKVAKLVYKLFRQNIAWKVSFFSNNPFFSGFIFNHARLRKTSTASSRKLTAEAQPHAGGSNSQSHMWSNQRCALLRGGRNGAWEDQSRTQNADRACRCCCGAAWAWSASLRLFTLSKSFLMVIQAACK